MISSCIASPAPYNDGSEPDLAVSLELAMFTLPSMMFPHAFREGSDSQSDDWPPSIRLYCSIGKARASLDHGCLTL